MRKVETILARFPGPVTLYPSRLKVLGGVVACLGLTVFSVHLLLDAIEANSSEVIWASASILVCGALTARGLLLLRPGTMGLTLDATGFEVGGILRRVRSSWRDAGNFRVAVGDDAAQLRLVRFEVLKDGATPQGRAKVTRALPGNYPLRDDDLAWLMEQWRLRALAPAS
jgi:hypothetical protein